MASGSNAATINTLAKQVMLNLPKLYGPNSLNGDNNTDGTTNPPADLVASLEQLETASVDPSLLTSSQTVASVENQTINDLNTFTSAVQAELALSNQIPSHIGAEDLFFILLPNFKAAATNVVADSKSFTAGGTPLVTIVDPPSPPSSGVEQYLVTNITTGVSDWEDGQIYDGPVANVQNQFISVTAENLNIIATKPGNFIHAGSGDNAISVPVYGIAGGSVNVLDGGGGSNFLVGAQVASSDTFYLDDRAPAADIWSTINNFHSGDTATVWGIAPSDFTLAWADNQGASGYTGLTLHASAAGTTASLTLAGYTSADLTNGKLTVTYGTMPATSGMAGNSYMDIHGNR